MKLPDEYVSAVSHGRCLFSLEILANVLLELEERGYKVLSVELFDKTNANGELQYVPRGISIRMEGNTCFRPELVHTFVTGLVERFGDGFFVGVNVDPPLR
jgi:hypothetical protein